MDTLATALRARIDDELKASPWLLPTRLSVGIAPTLSDADLTLAVMSALLGCTSERRWLRQAGRDFRHLFPYLPGQSGYNTCLRSAASLLANMIRALATDTNLWSDDVWVVDSAPGSCGCSARRPSARTWPAGPSTGYCAWHSRYFWGLRLQLVCTLGGLPVLSALTGAKADERETLRDPHPRPGRGHMAQRQDGPASQTISESPTTTDRDHTPWTHSSRGTVAAPRSTPGPPTAKDDQADCDAHPQHPDEQEPAPTKTGHFVEHYGDQQPDEEGATQLVTGSQLVSRDNDRLIRRRIQFRIVPCLGAPVLIAMFHADHERPWLASQAISPQMATLPLAGQVPRCAGRQRPGRPWRRVRRHRGPCGCATGWPDAAVRSDGWSSGSGSQSAAPGGRRCPGRVRAPSRGRAR